MAKPSNKNNKSSESNKGNDDLDLSDLYNEAEPAAKMAGIPVGTWNCTLAGAEMERDGKKSVVYLNFEGAEGEAEGKKGRIYYGITDEKGAPSQGLNYLRRDLGMLEVEKDKGESFEDFLDSIADKGVSAVVKVKENGEYTNLYIQGPAIPEIEPDEPKSKSKSKSKSKAKDEDEDEGEDEDELNVGDQVEGENADGEEVVGKITRIKGDYAFIEDEDEDIHKIKLDELSKVRAKSKDKSKDKKKPAPRVGDEVTWEDDDGDEQTGEIVKILDDVAKIEDDAGDFHRIKLDELTVQ